MTVKPLPKGIYPQLQPDGSKHWRDDAITRIERTSVAWNRVALSHCRIDQRCLNRVAAISEAIGRLTVLTDQARALRLRMILDAVNTSTREDTPEDTPEVRLLSVLAGEMTRQQLREALGLKDDEHFRKAYLLPALEAGWVERTIPDKPRSGKQKYRLTDKGRQVMARQGGW